MARRSVTRLPLLLLLSVLLTGCVYESVRPNGLVVILTDYGETDSYVGSLKGAMYSVFPNVRIDTVTNNVEPFDVVKGAHILAEAASEFPAGTVFCAIVDPGVGTSRNAIVALSKDGKYFVGPDNGLLSFALDEGGVREVRKITNRRLFREQTPSSTFQGRDVFGPVAARLASGLPLNRVGPRLRKYVRLELPNPNLGDNYIEGTIVYSDSYGNLTTNIDKKLLERAGIREGAYVELMIATLEQPGTTVRAKFVRTYAEVPEGELLCVIDSRGRLEIAVNMGNAAHTLGVRPDANVRVSRASTG